MFFARGVDISLPVVYTLHTLQFQESPAYRLFFCFQKSGMHVYAEFKTVIMFYAALDILVLLLIALILLGITGSYRPGRRTA